MELGFVVNYDSVYFLPGVSMTVEAWGHYPEGKGHGPTFEGSWRFQVGPKPKEARAYNS